MQSSFRLARHICFKLSFFMILLLPLKLRATSHEVLYRFMGGPDGASPTSSLLLDGAGNLYGTALTGGDLGCSVGYGELGCGVVFELKHSAKRQWEERVLYAFQGGTDGIAPGGNLVFDAAGNLYGTTSSGGTGTYCNNGCGTVFQLSPKADGTWTETVLYSFQYSSDGAQPNGLVIDAFGNLFGVSIFRSGVVYELSPPEQKGGSWKETTIQAIGAFPGLTLDGKGNLFGSDANGCCGGVFELERVGKIWHGISLSEFLGGGNGEQPDSGVVLDGKGNVYGTAARGGNDWGIVFEVELSANFQSQIMLHNFCSLNNCADGALPEAPLVFDQLGNLYGTTAQGGTGCRFPGCGVIFKLTPTKNGKWDETVLHSFEGGLDGDGPSQGVTLDSGGHIYGTTQYGGAASGGFGTVFKITP